MTMKMLFIFLACFAGPDFDSAVLFLSGASSIEDLDETTIERYTALQMHPVELNFCSRSRLLSSGLMSAFQAASLIDWRERSGDILSYAELALVDGFSPDYAEALKPFTRLSASGSPGHRRSHKLKQVLMLRSAAQYRGDDDLSYAGGFRYKASLGERAELNWAARTTYSDKAFLPGTISAAYYGRRYLGKIVLGHFNARFGQGLAIWNGFSMSPWSSVSAFRRSPTGISATSSFSPAHCGLAADFDYKAWTFSTAYSFTDKMPIGALSYTGRRFTAGLNACADAISADFRLGLPGAGLYGELAWNKSPAAVLGCVWIPTYGTKIGGMARYSEDLAELAAGLYGHSIETVIYGSTKQFRFMGKYAPELNAGPVRISPALRLAACHKSGWRLESRGEIGLDAYGWMARCRLDIVHCAEHSWLFNAEAGRSEGRFKAWLRWTLFKVDEWDGRIYVYERDAPGSFNVPAYYGRGWALSLAAAWKPSAKHSCHLRASALEYPWTAEYKSPKYEVKLQYQISL